MSSVSKKRRESRNKRKRSIRKRLHGTAARPRISVFRSHKNIYAQVVDDDEGRTLLSSSGTSLENVEAPKGVGGKCAAAYGVGKAVAALAAEKGIKSMVFDRSGYLYHGRVAALARGLRDGGVKV
ncbi:50S ribosomal protein L18 [bacterium]|nr:MAG: 50S ribosomal protein L18 [bacterium]